MSKLGTSLRDLTRHSLLVNQRRQPMNEQPSHPGHRDPRGRLFLVPGGGLRRTGGRDRGRVGLCRRQDRQPDVPAGVHGLDRPRRGRADHLRPRRHLLPGAAGGLLLDPRPDDPEPAGERRGHAVPLGHLLPHAGAEADRGAGHRRVGRCEGVAQPHRDRGGAAHGLHPGRGLPPGVFRAQRLSALLPDRRRAQAGEVQKEVRGQAEDPDLCNFPTRRWRHENHRRQNHAVRNRAYRGPSATPTARQDADTRRKWLSSSRRTRA